MKGKSPTVEFTVSGIDVKDVQLKSSGLVVEGQRFALVFTTFENKTTIISRYPLVYPGVSAPTPETVRIEIAKPADDNFGPALDAVFSNLAGLVPGMPPVWQPYAQKHFVEQADPSPAKVEPPPPTPGTRRVGGGVTPPRVLKAPRPEMNEYAGRSKISGERPGLPEGR